MTLLIEFSFQEMEEGTLLDNQVIYYFFLELHVHGLQIFFTWFCSFLMEIKSLVRCSFQSVILIDIQSKYEFILYILFF